MRFQKCVVNQKPNALRENVILKSPERDAMRTSSALCTRHGVAAVVPTGEPNSMCVCVCLNLVTQIVPKKGFFLPGERYTATLPGIPICMDTAEPFFPHGRG